MTFLAGLSKASSADKNSITFHCGCATIITHLKTVPLIEHFITPDSLCIVHYLVFAKLMALPLHFPYLCFFRIGFYISKPARYDKSFSFLLSLKKSPTNLISFFSNNHHLEIKVIGSVCITQRQEAAKDCGILIALGVSPLLFIVYFLACA